MKVMVVVGLYDGQEGTPPAVTSQVVDVDPQRYGGGRLPRADVVAQYQAELRSQIESSGHHITVYNLEPRR